MNNEMLKKIEAEVIKNVKNGTTYDMSVHHIYHHLSEGNDIDKYELVYKGKSIVTVAKQNNQHNEIIELRLSINDKQIDDVDNHTILDVFKALEGIYIKQDKEINKRIKIAKSKQNAETIFNMIGRQIFGESKQK